jgi:hypothetical protein
MQKMDTKSISDELFMLIHSFKGSPAKVTLQDHLLKLKFNFNENTFLSACKCLHQKTILHFFDNKFIPTTKYFNYVLHVNTYYSKIKENIINDFLNFGYMLTYNELLLTILKKIKINSINKFNFEYDERFYDACAQANFYPYPEKDKFKQLLCECKNGNIYNIKELMTGNIKPNIDCLFEACKSSNNYAIIRLILSKGVIPNLKCVQQCLTVGHTKTIKMITEQYCHTHDDSICTIIDGNTIFGEITKCTNKKHVLSQTLTTFYKKNIPMYFEQTKIFGGIKKNINDYIKQEKLLTQHTLSFKINKELSCFGLPEGTIIQNVNMNNFISHILMYSPNDENDNDNDDEIIIKKKTKKLSKN